jgi:hypothetical protein
MTQFHPVDIFVSDEKKSLVWQSSCLLQKVVSNLDALSRWIAERGRNVNQFRSFSVEGGLVLPYLPCRAAKTFPSKTKLAIDFFGSSISSNSERFITDEMF